MGKAEENSGEKKNGGGGEVPPLYSPATQANEKQAQVCLGLSNTNILLGGKLSFE